MRTTIKRATRLPLANALSRPLTTTARHQTSWSPQPAPPRLPKEEQEIFEQLQRQSTGAFSTPREPNDASTTTETQAPEAGASVASTSAGAAEISAKRSPPQINQSPQYKVNADGKGEELHPAVRRGAKPEFEGDVNPKTGETGGPKNEPLRWGPNSDWSFNGRATDF